MVTTERKVERKALSLNRSRARDMRRKPPAMEKLLWSEVRDRKLGGHKFKRQYLIGRYIADFACVEKKFVVELDGPHHAATGSYDMARDEYLQSQGWQVMRLRNEALAGDVATVLLAIRFALDSPSPQPSPPLCGGEGEYL
jgi:very-short-patch-repair endonuclease